MLALRKAIATFRQLEAGRLLPAPEPNRADFPYAGSLVFQGLLIYVENPKGSTRSGTAADGTRWSTVMPAHYGEFAGTLGMDGDPVDVFVGDDHEAPDAFVVHQKVPGTQRPDEDKVILGVRTAAEAKALFMSAYSKPGFFGGMTRWSLADLRAHLLEGRAPGARLDLPPHLVGMIKAARSRELLVELLKNAQLSLFGGPTPSKHAKVVSVRGHVRRDGSIVPAHVRHVLVDDVEQRQPEPPPPPKPTPQERYRTALNAQRAAVADAGDVLAPTPAARAWMRKEAETNTADTWEERGHPGEVPADLVDRVESILHDNHRRFAAVARISEVDREVMMRAPWRREVYDVATRAIGDTFDEVARGTSGRKTLTSKLAAARAMLWAEPTMRAPFSGGKPSVEPLNGVEDNIKSATGSTGFAFAVRMTARRVANQRADQLIEGSGLSKDGPERKQFYDEAYGHFMNDVRDYMIRTMPLRVAIWESALAAYDKMDLPLSDRAVETFGTNHDAGAFAWGVAEQSRFHQPSQARLSVNEQHARAELKRRLDGLNNEGELLGHWGRAESTNATARASAVYGDAGVLNPSDKGFEPMTLSEADLGGPLEQLEGLGRYARAQTMMAKFPRDQHPTLWRGMIIGAASVERLQAGDTVPLTGCTAFTFIPSVAERYSSSTWSRGIAEATHGDDLARVVLHLERTDDFDRTVAGWHPRMSDMDDLNRSAFEIVAAVHGFRVTKKMQRPDGVWEIHGQGVP